MIVAEHISKTYGAFRALDDVSFALQPGESVAFWGANGAGKTTALRCLMGVLSFDGQLTVNSLDVRKQGKAVRAAIGYVPQEAVFYDLTVGETLQFYARLKKMSAERIDMALEQVQLAAQGDKSVNALSGGMKQRLALAVSLLADPPILILDEPTANLDVQAQADFIEMIQTLNKNGKTVVFSSHRLDEVLALAGRVLVLEAGKLALECQPVELADRLGLRQWLRLQIPPDERSSAAQILTKAGYTFAPNGASVYVRLGAEGKMAPIRTLETAQIAVQDFDVVDQPTGEAHHDE